MKQSILNNIKQSRFNLFKDCLVITEKGWNYENFPALANEFDKLEVEIKRMKRAIYH